MTPPEADPTPELPATRRAWAAILAELGVRPSKGLGQHFLYERGIVQRLVRQAAIGRDDLVLEIGPGLGILTSELLGRAGRVVAVELDARLAAHLRRFFGADPRLRLVEGNALDLATADLIPPGEPFVVAANLPYAVGSAVIRHLLEQPHRPRRLAVMLQKEVAERIVARPPEMSILGVACQFYAEGRLAFDVPPEVFLPPPTVESAVILLDVRPEPLLPTRSGTPSSGSSTPGSGRSASRSPTPSPPSWRYRRRRSRAGWKQPISTRCGGRRRWKSKSGSR
jgi:16S rRNA (adenine1518-N6/adenine1519-N6)-dimethyltransferase